MDERREINIRFKVIDTETGGIVKNAFVLLPKVDSAARVALASYMEATHNVKVARFLRLWLQEIHNERKKDRGRG